MPLSSSIYLQVATLFLSGSEVASGGFSYLDAVTNYERRRLFFRGVGEPRVLFFDTLGEGKRGCQELR